MKKAILIPFCMLVTTSLAHADQTVTVGQNGTVNCLASEKELTRLNIVGDQVASIQKIAGSDPARDFSVAHEPVTGDIYLSLPVYTQAKSVAFFMTSKKAFTYKVVCSVAPVGAQQIFVVNPAIALSKAREFESQGTPNDVAIKLIQAMWNHQVIDGYSVVQPYSKPVDHAGVRARVVSEYRGAGFVGKVVQLQNIASTTLKLNPAELVPSNTTAEAFAKSEIAPGEMTYLFLVGHGGN